MENEAIQSVAVGQSVAATDMSVWSLFMQADPIVKLVMLLLLAASFWSWAIIFDKLLKLRRLRAIADRFEEMFWAGGSLVQLYERVGVNPQDPMSAVFGAGMREWKGANDNQPVKEGRTGTVLQRVERAMRLALGREMEGLERHLTFLASVGSTAPFIGLFGTVWGIMNSFQSIAISKNTSLAVVAPGIAEALFATAMGLVAAIPAVVAYNKISNELKRYAYRVEGFSEEFSAVLARGSEGKAAMAMQLPTGGGSYRPMSEINVTPMVDVMLVLLIVFMVTAPLMTVGVPVDLPKSDAGTLGGQDEPLVVSVNSKGEVFLQETQLKLEELAPRLVAISGNNPEARIFIRGDQAINYGRIMEVMSTISAAGFNRVGLVARTSGEGRKPDRG